jgi:hypothetical protein
LTFPLDLVVHMRSICFSVTAVARLACIDRIVRARSTFYILSRCSNKSSLCVRWRCTRNQDLRCPGLLVVRLLRDDGGGAWGVSRAARHADACPLVALRKKLRSHATSGSERKKRTTSLIAKGHSLHELAALLVRINMADTFAATKGNSSLLALIRTHLGITASARMAQRLHCHFQQHSSREAARTQYSLVGGWCDEVVSHV